MCYILGNGHVGGRRWLTAALVVLLRCRSLPELALAADLLVGDEEFRSTAAGGVHGHVVHRAVTAYLPIPGRHCIMSLSRLGDMCS